MSFRSNLHTHSRYSDGKDLTEEYVKAALELGLTSLGFSEHAYAPYDTDCCMKEDALSRYLGEIGALKKTYSGKIELLTGLEFDYYTPCSRDGLDYVIGSVHYLKDRETGEYLCIDYLPETFEQAIARIGKDDIRKMIAYYYELVADMAVRHRPDILGHMDLICKLNKDKRYFDPQSKWYLDITARTAKAIKESGCIVEVNTGGMSRGYTAGPYPSAEILRQLRTLDVPVTISSDAHEAAALTACFPDAQRHLYDAGYRTVLRYEQGKFIEEAIVL